MGMYMEARFKEGLKLKINPADFPHLNIKEIERDKYRVSLKTGVPELDNESIIIDLKDYPRLEDEIAVNSIDTLIEVKNPPPVKRLLTTWFFLLIKDKDEKTQIKDEYAGGVFEEAETRLKLATLLKRKYSGHALVEKLYKKWLLRVYLDEWAAISLYDRLTDVSSNEEFMKRLKKLYSDPEIKGFTGQSPSTILSALTVHLQLKETNQNLRNSVAEYLKIVKSIKIPPGSFNPEKNSPKNQQSKIDQQLDQIIEALNKMQKTRGLKP